MIFDKLTLAAGVALGLLIASGPAYLYGKHAGASQARSEAVERTIEVIKQRTRTNAQVNRMSPADLCAGLDGVWVQDHCE